MDKSTERQRGYALDPAYLEVGASMGVVVVMLYVWSRAQPAVVMEAEGESAEKVEYTPLFQ